MLVHALAAAVLRVRSAEGCGQPRGNAPARERGRGPGPSRLPGRPADRLVCHRPASSYPALARSRVLRPVDDTPVWSISCLFVARAYRNQGVSVKLLKAATEFVRERGGTVVEGYPVEPRQGVIPPVFAWTGLPSAFRRAGFVEVARGSETRPIMRLTVRRRQAPRQGG